MRYSIQNKGVQLLLNAVVDYMPSPVDVKAIEGELEDGTKTERHSSDSEPFSALSFKVMTNPFVGRLTFLRVYSGVITSGSYVLNSTNGKKNVFQDWFVCMLTKDLKNLKYTLVISVQLLV